MKEESKREVLEYAPRPRVLAVSYAAAASVVLPMLFRLGMHLIDAEPDVKVFGPALGLRMRLLVNLGVYCGPYVLFGALGTWGWWRGRCKGERDNELVSIGGMLLNAVLAIIWGIHIYHQYNGYL